MKILSFGGMNLSNSLRKLGHEILAVVNIGMAKHKDDIEYDFWKEPYHVKSFINSLVVTFNPDLIFQGDDSTPLIHTGIENYDIPKIWYAVDTHLHYEWHKHYAAIFNIVFCAQQKYVEYLKEYQNNVFWLPLYSGKYSTFNPWIDRKYDVSFVGKLNSSINPHRCAFFRELNKHIENLTLKTGDFLPVYSNSKIVINESACDDLNLRFFEAPACGALLLTNKISHSMNDILISNIEYMHYEHGNVDQCIKIISNILDNKKYFEKMAFKSHKKIIENHMELNRAMFVDSIINSHIHDSIQYPESLVQLILTWEYCSHIDMVGFIEAGKLFQKYATNNSYKLLNNNKTILWGNLILAKLLLDNNQFLEANSFLLRIKIIPKNADFRKIYFTIKCLLEIYDKKINKAISTLNMGLSEFPIDEKLNQIKKYLC